MAVSLHTYQYLLESYQAEHNLPADTLHLLLMNDTFAFDPAVHATLADVASYELPTGNGYTQGGVVLTSVTASIDAVGERVLVTCDNFSIAASGGDLPPTASAIIYNNTHANDTVVLCIDFGQVITLVDGGVPLDFDFVNGFSEALISSA